MTNYKDCEYYTHGYCECKSYRTLWGVKFVECIKNNCEVFNQHH